MQASHARPRNGPPGHAVYPARRVDPRLVGNGILRRLEMPLTVQLAFA